MRYLKGCFPYLFPKKNFLHVVNQPQSALKIDGGLYSKAPILRGCDHSTVVNSKQMRHSLICRKILVKIHAMLCKVFGRRNRYARISTKRKQRKKQQAKLRGVLFYLLDFLALDFKDCLSISTRNSLLPMTRGSVFVSIRMVRKIWPGG